MTTTAIDFDSPSPLLDERTESGLGSALAREIITALRADPSLRAELRRLLVLTAAPEAADSTSWMNIDEAADYLRVSARTLERRIARGELASKTIGRRRVIRRRDLDVFAEGATAEDDHRPVVLRRAAR